MSLERPLPGPQGHRDALRVAAQPARSEPNPPWKSSSAGGGPLTGFVSRTGVRDPAGVFRAWLYGTARVVCRGRPTYPPGKL